MRLLKPMLTALVVLAGASFGGAQETKTNKTFIDYYLPTLKIGFLTANVCGAAMDRDLQCATGSSKQ